MSYLQELKAAKAKEAGVENREKRAKATTLTTYTTLASSTQESALKPYDQIPPEPPPPATPSPNRDTPLETSLAEPAKPKKQFRNIPFKFTARQLLNGEKTQTRRRPDKYTTTWRAGEIFTALGENDEAIAHIKAQTVRKQRLGDITEDEARLEGFKDLAAFRAEWIKYYRKFDEDLEVMVLEFEVLPVESVEFPASGRIETLEDFHSHDHYPKVQDGELLLVDIDGRPATDPTILTAWQAVKGEIQAGLEARHAALITWAEALLGEHARVYLTTPDDITCEWETSTRVDDPQRLAAEVLRCEACGMYYKVRTAHLWQAYRAREGAN